MRTLTPSSDVVQRIQAKAHWDDLILPSRELQLLRTLAAEVRQRVAVHDDPRSGRLGPGVAALFHGAKGTGRTLAAIVLATELEVDLYRVDLAAVVSKYVGETEKNLRRTFERAERAGAVLLFDEAEALFGRRGEVRDSHDRYADIESAHLLRMIESHCVLAILTTNRKAALDPAFLRRLRFVIRFASRRRAIPVEAPADESAP